MTDDKPIDRRTLRRGPRPGVGGRHKKIPTRRISARMPEPEYAEFRQLSADLNENQAILRAIRLWVDQKLAVVTCAKKE